MSFPRPILLSRCSGKDARFGAAALPPNSSISEIDSGRIGMTIVDQAGGTPLPLYQLVLLGLFGPPFAAAVFCLRIKGLGKEYGTSKLRMVRNTTDWVAFWSFTASFYAIFIACAVYAYFRRH